MALINCPECGKQISDLSSVCIHCGYQLKKTQFTAAPVKTPDEAPAPAVPESGPDKPASGFTAPVTISPESRKKWLIIGCAVALVAVIVLVLVLVLGGNKEETAPAEAPAKAADSSDTIPAPESSPDVIPSPENLIPGNPEDEAGTADSSGSASAEENSPGIISALSSLFSGNSNNENNETPADDSSIVSPENPDDTGSQRTASDSLTYGITPAMTVDQVVETVKNSGLTLDGDPRSTESEYDIYCTGEKMFDIASSRVHIYLFRYGPGSSDAVVVILRYYLNDADWNTINTESYENAYSILSDGMSRRFGTPRKVDDDYIGGLYWETDGMVFGMPPVPDDPYGFHTMEVIGASTFEEMIEINNRARENN